MQFKQPQNKLKKNSKNLYCEKVCIVAIFDDVIGFRVERTKGKDKFMSGWEGVFWSDFEAACRSLEPSNRLILILFDITSFPGPFLEDPGNEDVFGIGKFDFF